MIETEQPGPDNTVSGKGASSLFLFFSFSRQPCQSKKIFDFPPAADFHSSINLLSTTFFWPFVSFNENKPIDLIE